MKYTSAVVTLSIFCLMIWQPVKAYDKTGHRIVAQIAAKNLTSKARTEIEKVLGRNGLVNYANWPDEIRSNPAYNYATKWHFINVDKDYTSEELDLEYTNALLTRNNLLFAIDSLTAALKKNRKDSLALRFLVHLIGDLHQPLHVGREADYGGNRIRIKWFNDSTNLHSLWDTYMVNMEQLSYTEYAAYLSDAANFQQLKWESTDVKSAFKRAYFLSRKVYNYPYDGKNAYGYYYNFSPGLKELLTRGGCLLANILNKIYA
ncbi:MAG TPA: S1/P1 nuclease [Niastella sp.]|nr:S1/P1 nuclease [Niastella sp.]